MDTNVLVYAHRRDSGWYGPASRCMKVLAEGGEPWGIPWPCIHEFLAIVSHPKIYQPPTPLPEALDQVEIWMESPSLRLLGEMSGYWGILKDLLRPTRLTGGAIHDARVAAICKAHGIRELWSADRDFNRFGSLKTRNPLTA